MPSPAPLLLVFTLLHPHAAPLAPANALQAPPPAPAPPPLGWSYHPEACSKALFDAGERVELYPQSPEDDEGIMRTPFVPFDQALQAPPGTLLGDILLEGGDGCRYYYPSVAYYFVRARKPGFSSAFARVRTPPPALGTMRTYSTTSDPPKRIAVRVLHRGLVDLYEVTYDSVSPASLRRAAIGCLRYARP